jgi:enoyl-CoA hydratase/carnithine racemase
MTESDVRPLAQDAPVTVGDAEPQLISTVMDGAVAVLTMQKAPYNLLDAELNLALVEAFAWAQRQGARAAVLRSSLRHFCAGADLDQMLAAAEVSDILDWGLGDVLKAFTAFPAPIVASVHGVCVGGGFELALASDLVVAAASAKIGSVESTVGLHPLMGGIQRITQRAGAARAKEMAMLGRRYDAETMERWGLVNKVVPDEQLDAATMVLAQELAHGPTVCHTATKKLVSVAVEDGVEAADEAMAEIQRAIFRSQDFRTGVQSYRENGVGMARFQGR